MKPLDPQGFPGSIGEKGEFDGGDTAAILGTLWFFEQDINVQFPFSHGETPIPLRHPDTTKWYGQPDRFSRDQLIPVLCSLIKTDTCIPALETAAKRRFYLTAWNTKKNGSMDAPDKFPDITGPEVWSLWIRYKRPWWARLVLWALDIEHLIGALDWRFRRKDRVCRNHMLVSLMTKKYMPTLVSRLAYSINNWPDLLDRWEGHCRDTREYDTSEMFRKAVK